MTHAIEVENLTKYYDKFLAVDHINFTVEQGEIFGFLGPNGAGKTTTQRMLTTLLTPTEGRILVNGHDLSRDAYPAKRQIGLVPEESNSPLTYAQDLMNHAVLGSGLLDPWLDLSMLALSGLLFLFPAVKMHQRAQVLG
jgi:ABC-type multidrug transport system ATPase subunit